MFDGKKKQEVPQAAWQQALASYLREAEAMVNRARRTTNATRTSAQIQCRRAAPRRHAHGHTFLAGAARSERRIHWLPPIAVNVDDLEAAPSTVRPVKAHSQQS